ncbi:MAG: M23 family metallopeptidase [Bacteroidota bacterium]
MIIQLLLISAFQLLTGPNIRIPIDAPNRKLIEFIKLTEIGQFGLKRKDRKEVPEHLHTGIDIQRPNKNYSNAAIYAIDAGTVISKREDGPFAQVIIEHDFGNLVFWTVYEHIAEIQVDLFQEVDSETKIARFFNLDELNQYGWQFDHFHFEVLKRRPIRIQPKSETPERLYNSFTLNCFVLKELNDNFYSPLDFLESHF